MRTKTWLLGYMFKFHFTFSLVCYSPPYMRFFGIDVSYNFLANKNYIFYTNVVVNIQIVTM